MPLINLVITKQRLRLSLTTPNNYIDMRLVLKQIVKNNLASSTLQNERGLYKKCKQLGVEFRSGDAAFTHLPLVPTPEPFSF